jgi:Fe-S cluster biosynthesis and repair protein YggX
MGAVRDWFDGFPMFDGMMTSSDEAAQEGLTQAGIDAANDLAGNQPGVNDLAGYGLFAGQTPQEYIDAYIAENGRADMGPGGHLSGNRSDRANDRLTQEAQQQWLQEQMGNDPLFGLNVADQSQLASASPDAGAYMAQRNALREMQGIYDAGGYTDSERAQLQMSQRDAAMGERSQRLAVQQQMAARGMGGGGMEMMGALAAQQGGANRANDAANQISIAGQQRALQALQQSGAWAGQMRDQSFNEDTTRRTAADAWNQYQTGLIDGRQTNLGNANQQAFGNAATATAIQTNQYGQAAGYYGQQEQEGEDAAGHITDTVAGAISGGMQGGAGGAIGGIGKGNTRTQRRTY